jgi:hypothetical protein
MPPRAATELTTETRVRVLEAGHRVLTEQQAELGLAMSEGKECMRDIIRDSVQAALPHTMPSAKQLEWLDMLIAREAKKAAFQQAIIDKTVTALVWSALAGLGLVLWTMFKEYAQAHGWKP